MEWIEVVLALKVITTHACAPNMNVYLVIWDTILAQDQPCLAVVVIKNTHSHSRHPSTQSKRGHMSMNQELSTEPDSLADTAMLARAKACMDCTDVVEEGCWCSIVVPSQHPNTK